MLRAETTYVPSSDGVKVAVHDFGGDGPLLLLNHATGFCANTLAPMIATLRASFRCVALDFRAHGYTELPEGAGLTWLDLAADFAAVARHLAPDGDLLAFGHSMGGSSIILTEAATPGTVRRAWMWEPILLPAMPTLIGDDEPEIASAASRRRATFASRDEALERYSSRPPLSVLDRRALEAYVDHGFEPVGDGSITLRCKPEHEALVFANHGSGAFERVADVRIPMVIAAGGDGQGPAQWINDAARQHGSLTVHTYDDLTHFGPLQDPERVASDAAQFLLGDEPDPPPTST